MSPIPQKKTCNGVMVEDDTTTMNEDLSQCVNDHRKLKSAGVASNGIMFTPQFMKIQSAILELLYGRTCSL
jgi:hypothetical protein